MSLSVGEFWPLLAHSRLVTPQQIEGLRQQAADRINDPHTPAQGLAEWLVGQHVLSPYQASVLLGGAAGPFFYGEYRIWDRIPDGRFRGCFRAVHTATRHPVLLRFLTGTLTQDAGQWNRSQRYVQQQAGVRHPRLQPIFECEDTPPYRFLVFEEPSGEPLQRQMAGGPLPPPHAARIVSDILQALAAMHQQGNIHADVRPENIWYHQGTAQLLRDWPLPRTVAPCDPSDVDEESLARWDYVAPELTVPSRQPDVQSDIYAAGCLLYQLLSGRVPFAGGDVPTKRRQHCHQKIEPLDMHAVPAELAHIVTYMMAKNPVARFSSAETVAEQLGRFALPASPTVSPAPSLLAFQQHLQAKHSQAARPLGSAGLPSGRPAGVPAERPLAVATSSSSRGGTRTSWNHVLREGEPAAASATAPDVTVSAAERTSGPSSQDSSPIDTGFDTAIVDRLAWRRFRDRRRRRIMLVAASAGMVGVLLLASFIAFRVLNPDYGAIADQDVDTTEQVSGRNGGREVADVMDRGTADGTAGTRQIVVPDDNLLLWASPTEGSPIDLDYVPPGGQLFLYLRPASMLASEEGRRVFRSLGPSFDAARQNWEQQAGVTLDQVDRLLIALYDNLTQFPRVAYVVRLNEQLSRSQLQQNWGSPTAREESGNTYFVRGELAYWLPDQEESVFLMGPVEDVREAAAIGGAPPAMRREIEQLRAATDQDRHVTLLFTPYFLFSGGEPLFSGSYEQAHEPLQWFLGDGLQAGMVSMHFGDPFYVEGRFMSSLDRDYYTLASDFQDRLEQVPSHVESHMVQLNPHPYWRAVAFRLPGMIRYLHGQTRIGVEQNHAVVNAVLPAPAAHNLAFAGSMLLESPPDPALAATPTAPSDARVTGPGSIDEVLHANLTLAFDQTSLEFALEDLASEVQSTYPDLPDEFNVRILGPHLEQSGITRNQQVRDVNERNKPVREILTTIVRLANPIPHVSDPAHQDQLLIWVVADDPLAPGQQAVLITTRAAAEQNDYTIPEEFTEG